MDWNAILVAGLWAGIMAGGLAIFFTVPKEVVLVAALAGFVGRAARTAMVQNDQGVIRATLVAALAVSLVTVLLARRRHLSPIVAMSALIPLGASVNAFDVIWSALKMPSADAATRAALAADFVGNAVTVMAVTFTIAVGFVIPWLAVRLLRGDES